jgi:hypothetical protein
MGAKKLSASGLKLHRFAGTIDNDIACTDKHERSILA